MTTYRSNTEGRVYNLVADGGGNGVEGVASVSANAPRILAQCSAMQISSNTENDRAMKSQATNYTMLAKGLRNPGARSNGGICPLPISLTTTLGSGYSRIKWCINHIKMEPNARSLDPLGLVITVATFM